MSKAAVSLIQSGLRDLGHGPGPIDGLFGAKTKAATLAWLDAGGAPASAALAPETTSMLYQGSARYPVTEIAAHCSATRPDWMHNDGFAAQIAEIKRWHTDPKSAGGRGWRDIGYHWLISRSGLIRPGRLETVIGAGIEGHNQGVIHVCLLGGFGAAETDRFDQHFTAGQNSALRDLLQMIGMRTQIRRISGHNEWAPKACPGFNVPQWLKEAA